MAKPITIKITGDSDGLKKALGHAETSMQKFGGAAGGVLKGVGLAATAAVAGIGLIGVQAMQSLVRIEKINAQTDAALKSTGAAAGVTRGHIEGLAGSIEGLTGIEAESIQQGQNLLLTFTGIQNGIGEGNDIFDQTTRIMTDMSVALGTDASGSAIQLGKALNDPVKGVTALSKVGVSFTEQQKEQIAAMVEAGDTMGAQKIILAELNKEFGGSAEAFGQTTAGKIERVKHAFGTVTEALVASLLPALTKTAEWLLKFMENAVPIAERVGPRIAEAFRSIGEYARSLATEYGPRVVAVLGKVRDAFGWLRERMDYVKAALIVVGPLIMVALVAPMAMAAASAVLAIAPFALVVAGLAALGAGVLYAWRHFEGFREGVRSVVAYFSGTLWPFLKQTFDDLKGMVTSAFTAIVAVVEVAVATFLNIWNRWGSDLWGTVKRTFDAVLDVIHGAIELLTGVFDLIKAILTGKWGEAWDAVKKILSGALEVIWGLLRGVGNTVEAILTGLRSILAAAFTTAWNAALTAVTDGWGKVSSFFSGIGGTIAGWATGWFNSGKALGKAIIDGIGDGITKIGGFVSDIASAIKGAVIDSINWVVDRLNEGIPNSLGFGPAKIDLPDNPIPRITRAMGGPASGVVRVGERGPEDVYLPNGSSVGANHSMSTGGVVVNVQTNANPYEIAREIAWSMRTSGR